MKKEKDDVLQNFTIVVYRKTRDEYFKFKEDNKLTHDEAFKKMLKAVKEEG